MSENLFDELVQLFRQSHAAHAQAFEATHGEDPEWPTWYANYLWEELKRLLNASFTISELVYLLVWVDKQHHLDAPGADWAVYYARFFTKRYL